MKGSKALLLVELIFTLSTSVVCSRSAQNDNGLSFMRPNNMNNCGTD